MTDSLELTDFDQHIYNTHLRISRTAKNQPFKYRKDFTSIDDKTRFYIKKIAIFLGKHSHIALNDFILAPYKIYSDESHFDLDFYITLKAIKAYTLYQNKKVFLDPDNMEQLENIKYSLQFISSFCRENNISIDSYIDHTINGRLSFLLHLKEHRVNVYCLLGYPSFDQKIKSVDLDLLSFIIGKDLIDNMPIFRTKFLNSTKARKFVELGLAKIKQNKLD
jgi:hypothetical protein